MSNETLRDTVQPIVTDTVTDAGFNTVERVAGRGAANAASGVARGGFMALRVGMRAVPVIGAGLLAYDLGNLVSEVATGRSLADNVGSLAERAGAAIGLVGRTQDSSDVTRHAEKAPSRNDALALLRREQETLGIAMGGEGRADGQGVSRDSGLRLHAALAATVAVSAAPHHGGIERD